MSLTIKEYFALAGSSFSNDDARVIGPVLQELAGDGDVTASAIVQAAHSANSPLRKYFEWDNEKAAGHYREGQAREMIQSVRVRFVSNGKEYATRAYQVSVKPSNNLPPDREVMLNTPHPSEMLAMALREIDAWRLKHSHLERFKRIQDIFLPLFNQIAEFREDFAEGAEPVDAERALSALVEWKQAHARGVPPAALLGEHIGYMVEAIDHAWDAFAKMKGDRDARYSEIEKENEDLREKNAYLEAMMTSDELLPRELGLTGKEAALVSILLKRDVVRKEALLSGMYTDGIDDVPEIKIIDVFICKVRDKLEPFGIKIETVWGIGYTMPPESKEELRGLIEAKKVAA